MFYVSYDCRCCVEALGENCRFLWLHVGNICQGFLKNIAASPFGHWTICYSSSNFFHTLLCPRWRRLSFIMKFLLVLARRMKELPPTRKKVKGGLKEKEIIRAGGSPKSFIDEWAPKGSSMCFIIQGGGGMYPQQDNFGFFRTVK